MPIIPLYKICITLAPKGAITVMLPAVAMILLLQMQASGGVVKASGSMSPARSLVTRYFENLKARRFHA
ncbi:MAG: hypothetical protein ACRDFX_03150, partial [Chloroflexota bacterium]